MSGLERTVVSPFRQPKAVWAVAFACVVSFMGIGLVDPILPALSTQLKASPSSVELLFTSYLVVTAVAMLATGWVSSRIGGKRTLVAGLVLIVAFSALAGSSGTIGGIIGFRAGWGLGNASPPQRWQRTSEQLASFVDSERTAPHYPPGRPFALALGLAEGRTGEPAL